MRKLRLSIFGVLTLITAVTLNMQHALNGYGVKEGMLHIEVLAQSGTTSGGSDSGGSSSSDCDMSKYVLTKYTINAAEEYVTTEIKYSGDVNIGLHAAIGTKTYAKLDASFGATLGGTAGIPKCEKSDCNICLKSFIEKTLNIINSPKLPHDFVVEYES